MEIIFTRWLLSEAHLDKQQGNQQNSVVSIKGLSYVQLTLLIEN